MAYPTDIDQFDVPSDPENTPTGDPGDSSPARNLPELLAALGSGLTATQTELGTDASGGETNVKNRIAAVEDDLAAGAASLTAHAADNDAHGDHGTLHLPGGTDEIPGLVAPRVTTARYIGILCQTHTTGILTGDLLRASPIWIPNNSTWDRIRAGVTIVGTVGSVVRLGVYADNGSGEPGALLLDAGTIDGTSATAQEITISLGPLTGGLYWLAAVGQGAPGTQPTMNILTGPQVPIGQDGTMNNTLTARSLAGVTGALPNPFGAGSITATGIGVKLRRA